MKKLALFIYYFLLIIFPIYLLLIFYSNYSLAGFWSDIYFTLILILTSILFVFKRNQFDKWFSVVCKFIQLCCLIVCTYFVISNLNSYVFWDRLKTRSFMNINCLDKQYNAYFHPVGAYSGGYGNVSVTKKLRYLPLFEEDVTFIHAIHYDLSEDFEDGSKLNHKHILSELIWEQFVLNDQNENKNIKPLNLSEIKSINIFNFKKSKSSTLSQELSENFVNQVNNSINIGMTKSFQEFEITINLNSGETRKLSVNGNSIKDWRTNDITFEAKDLNFLKRLQ